MSNLTEVTRIRSDPLEKQLWVKRAHGREMTLSEHLRDLANRDADGTEPPRRPGPKPKKKELGGGEDTVSGRQPAGEDSSPPSSEDLSTSATPAASSGDQAPGEAVVSDSDVPAAPRPFVDTSDFVPAECDHEPYKTQGNAWCYRCNSRI